MLQDTYAATREAFAAGRLRIEQVRVIVRAAEQIPASDTAEQVAMAEQWLVAQGTGEGGQPAADDRGTDPFVKRALQLARTTP